MLFAAYPLGIFIYWMFGNFGEEMSVKTEYLFAVGCLYALAVIQKIYATFRSRLAQQRS